MSADAAAAGQELFWDIADEMIAEGRAERGTLMGMPCLRAGGGFFAMADHRTGDLVVKLDEGRAHELSTPVSAPGLRRQVACSASGWPWPSATSPPGGR
jgi:hypothetical protein